MKLQDANDMVKKYGAALARGCPNGGIARYESYLPGSKDQIKKAFKLVLAFLIQNKSLTQKNAELYLGAVMAIDSFVPDETAKRINSDASLENMEYVEFTELMFGLHIRHEMDEFITKVQGFDTKDPLFHQRVYTLIGLEYSPSAKESFWDVFSI